MATKGDEGGDPVSAEQLHTALDDAKYALEKHPELAGVSRFLELVVARLIETEEKFNQHGHPTSTNLDSDEYQSAGSGFASSPAKPRGYGCHESIRIGR